MRIAVGIQHFDAPNGAATYTHVLARHLLRLGHEVRIHTPDAGAMAEVARAGGISVGEDAAETPDVMIANDAMIAFDLAALHPGVPQLFVAHGAYRDEAMPPQMAEVTTKVIVMNDRVAARVRSLASELPILRLRQPIDIERFRPRGAPRSRATVVVLVGNYLRGKQRDIVLDVFRRRGIEARQVGVHGTPTLRPELAIAEADIVVGYGRSALEGMACGRPTLVLDHRGVDGFVTDASYAALEADGFAGLTTTRPLTYDAVAASLDAYDPRLGEVGRRLVERHHNAFHHAMDVAAALPRAATAPVLKPSAAGELARLQRLQWESEWRSGVLLDDVSALQERCRALEEALEAAEGQAAQERAAREAIERRWAALTQTRRYRSMAAVVAPIDRLRAWRSRARELRRSEEPPD